MLAFIRQLLMCIVTITLMSSALADNFTFMEDSAITFFRGKDKEMMVNTATNALNNAKDGKKVMWKNANTGAWGYVIPSHTTKKEGLVCRQLLIYNNANNVPGQSTYKLCKVNQEWKLY